jgi:hypothetical protein
MRRTLGQLAVAVFAGVMASGLAWGFAQVIEGRHFLGPLGIAGQARYLVLAQSPAELRPAGGYTGTVGVITVSNGQLTERSFKDVYFYDLQPNIPFVEPPDELADHLLGTASWQLADAAWSPDFPTSAQNALHLYTLESGDADIDGVIALTTYAVDRLLEVTGPIDVPEYGVTVASGEVTMTALRLTRGVSTPDSDRKAFLQALADLTLDKLRSLPPADWPRLFDAFNEMRERREVLVWFADPYLQAAVATTPLGGSTRQDAGDYLAVVEANVSPTSKYNLVVTRRDSLTVTIDLKGQTTSDLNLTWQNDSTLPGEPYESIRSYSTSGAGQYGAFVRVLTTASTSFVEADGVATLGIDDVELVTSEAGRNVFGNYLLMDPGQSSLHYRWTAPDGASQAEGLWTYRLTVQKQPGVITVPTSVSVLLPAGAVIETLSGATLAADGTISMTTGLERDAEMRITYRLP